MAVPTDLLLTFLGADPKNVAACGKEEVPRITTDDGQKIKGLAAVCAHLGEHCPSAREVLGSCPEEKACIQQWLEYKQLIADASAANKEATDDVLKELNLYLKNRTYFVGNRLTLADVCIYYSLHPILVTLGFREKGKYNHVSRWFDLVQHDAKVRQNLARVVFSKTPLYER